MTCPNTLGLFDPNIRKIADRVHEVDGLLYCDGANMNAILGITRPGDFGADMQHYNVHKTFTGPHGGGGPGSGPIAVRDFLAPYLPAPIVVKDGGRFRLLFDMPKSIGARQTGGLLAAPICRKIVEEIYKNGEKKSFSPAVEEKLQKLINPAHN